MSLKSNNRLSIKTTSARSLRHDPNRAKKGANSAHKQRKELVAKLRATAIAEEDAKAKQGATPTTEEPNAPAEARTEQTEQQADPKREKSTAPESELERGSPAAEGDQNLLEGGHSSSTATTEGDPADGEDDNADHDWSATSSTGKETPPPPQNEEEKAEEEEETKEEEDDILSSLLDEEPAPPAPKHATEAWGSPAKIQESKSYHGCGVMWPGEGNQIHFPGRTVTVPEAGKTKPVALNIAPLPTPGEELEIAVGSSAEARRTRAWDVLTNLRSKDIDGSGLGQPVAVSFPEVLDELGLIASVTRFRRKNKKGAFIATPPATWALHDGIVHNNTTVWEKEWDGETMERVTMEVTLTKFPPAAKLQGIGKWTNRFSVESCDADTCSKNKLYVADRLEDAVTAAKCERKDEAEDGVRYVQLRGALAFKIPLQHIRVFGRAARLVYLPTEQDKGILIMLPLNKGEARTDKARDAIEKDNITRLHKLGKAYKSRRKAPRPALVEYFDMHKRQHVQQTKMKKKTGTAPRKRYEEVW